MLCHFLLFFLLIFWIALWPASEFCGSKAWKIFLMMYDTILGSTDVRGAATRPGGGGP